MAEDRSPHKTTPSGSSDLPLTRSLFAVFVAAIGSSSIGYALGYPSSALLDLAGLPGDRAFTRGSTASQLFGVSKVSLHSYREIITPRAFAHVHRLSSGEEDLTWYTVYTKLLFCVTLIGIGRRGTPKVS